MTAAELEAKFPIINWRLPIVVAWEGDSRQWFACRVCIANKGLNKKSTWQWLSFEEALKHIQCDHP